MTCNERNKAMTTDPEITQVTELGGKDIIQIKLCSTYSRTQKKVGTGWGKKWTICKTSAEHLQIKNTILEKNRLDGVLLC